MSSRYDKTVVKQAAAGRWIEILSSKCGLSDEQLNPKQHGPCPKCNGSDRFRALDDVAETGALFCNQCHREKNGDGFSSLQWLLGIEFKDALKITAEFCGISPNNKGRKPKADPAKDLEFQPWSTRLVTHFLVAKPGVTEAALLAAGANMARYKRQFTVIAIPIIGQDLATDKPVGWIVANYNGQPLPKWSPTGEVVGQTKYKITYGSKPGLVGVHAIERMATKGLVDVVWKVEGVSDLLSLMSEVPADLADRHVVVTNSNGAGQKPGWMAKTIAVATEVSVVHDSDQPGQSGAEQWCNEISASSDAIVRNVVLPYEVSEKDGNDLRDWIRERNSYSDLQNLKQGSQLWQVTEASSEDEAPDDDPGLVKVIADHICEDNHFARNSGGKLFRERDGAYRSKAEEFVKRKVKHYCEVLQETKRWSRRFAEEVVEFIRVDAQHLWEMPPSDIVNVTNGLLDLRNRILLPHSCEHLSPVQLPVKFDPKAKCPANERFVSEVLPPDATHLAWELLALLMTPNTSIQKAILLLGAGGNGKSTLLNTCVKFVGKVNTSSVSLHRLEIDRFAVSRLLGKMANICADLPTEHLEGTSTFKALTGGDPIEAEYKFRDSFSFEPYARLVFSANSPPRSSDSSEGFFDRWLVLPFDARFRGSGTEIPRSELDARLTTPEELSGLLNKAIEAWHGIQERGGLSEPESVRKACSEFHAMTDPLNTWLDQFTIDDPDLLVPKQALRSAYGAACERKGRPAPTDNAFSRALKKARPDVTKGQRTINGRVQWCFLGIGLRSNDSQVSQHSQDSPLLVTNRTRERSEQVDVDSVKQDRAKPVNAVKGVNGEIGPHFNSSSGQVEVVIE